MQMKLFKLGIGLLMGAAISIAAVGPSSAADAPVYKASPRGGPSSVVWTGMAFKEDVIAAFIGGMKALNGSLDSEGWLIRGQYLYVNYDFTSPVAPGGADGTLNRGDIQIGYQMVRGGLAGSFFMGIDYQGYDINPSAANAGRLSSEAGLMLSARLATIGGNKNPWSLEANYSTANDAYWVRGRGGVVMGAITYGAEIGVLGNTAFDEARYGVYTSWSYAPNQIIQLNGGWADRYRGRNFTGGNGDGFYGGFTFVFLQ